MDPWKSYCARMETRGLDRREAALKRERRFLGGRMPTSLSYHKLTVDGAEREMAVINSDDLTLKTLCSRPGEDIPHGGLVRWMDNYWLITEKDANNEVYTRAKMRQCNYLLRWVDDRDNILERWCVVEDGTKLKRVQRAIVWRIGNSTQKEPL